MSLNIYQQNILDHYRNPRNTGALEPAQAHAHITNPLCGDELDFYLNFHQDRVSQAQFTGRGCTISIAAASMLSEKLTGLTKAEIVKLPTDVTIQLLGVPVNPARMKCATLSLEAVQRAVGRH